MSDRQTPSIVSALPGPLTASFPRQLSLLLMVLIPLALLIAWRMPITHPEGDFINNLLDVAKTGHVSSTFTPDAYPYIAGLAYKAGGPPGFLAVQAITYLLLASGVLWLIWALTRGARAAFAGSLIICLDPDLLSSIPKVWDTGFTCLLLTAFAGLCIAAFRKASPGVLLALATLWGFGVSVRPNFALLLLPIVYLLITAGDRAWIVKSAAIAVWGFGVFALMNVLAHGSFYVAQNGPYNIYAGANTYTLASLEKYLNAEGSVPPALADLGVHVKDGYDLSLRPLYIRESSLFIEHHPFEWLYFGGAKLLTLLRPDTKAHGLLTPPGLIKVFTSLCFPLWIVTLIWVKKLEAVDLLILVIAACYILPFLLSNADPRFRPPLDVLVLCHAASLIIRRFTQEGAKSTGRSDRLETPAPAAAS